MNEMELLCQRYGAHPDCTAFLGKAYEKLQANEEAFSVFLQQVQVYKDDYLFDHKPVMAALRALEATTGLAWETIHMLYTIYLLPSLEAVLHKKLQPFLSPMVLSDFPAKTHPLA